MLQQANRIITIMILATALVFMGCLVAQDSVAFAEDEGVVLKVFYDDEYLEGYSIEELEQIARADGNGRLVTYNYSAMNMYPSADMATGVTGPKVRSIVEDALDKGAVEGKSPNSKSLDLEQMSNKLIDIKETENPNSFHAVFTVNQLFGDRRYYYPHAYKYENARYGATALSESYTDAELVPAVFSLTETKHPAKEGRLLVGQLAPNEQNQPDWVQGVIKGTSNPGQIIISSKDADRLNPVTKTDTGMDSKVEFGKVITFYRDVNAFQNAGGKRYWIYYTTDGSEPTRDSKIYNCNNYDFGESYEKFNKPILSKDKGESTLKVKVFGNGRIESDTSVFEGVEQENSDPSGEGEEIEQEDPVPVVLPKLAKPSIKKLKLKKRTITLQWKTVAGASGYQIYRAEKKAKKKTGKYKLVKTVKNGKTASWKNKNLKKGKRYFYKIRAYRIVKGKKEYSSFSAVKNKKVK